MLSQALKRANVPHLLLESDYQKVEATRSLGAPVSYGDASRLPTLVAAGLDKARLLVLTFSQPRPAVRIAQAVFERHPQLAVVVSCRQVRDASTLHALPNVRVYHESFAAAHGLAELVLLHSGVSVATVNTPLSEMRTNLASTDQSRNPPL